MTNTKKNPYITGRSIHEPEKLFGCEELFEFIKGHLNNNAKIILLHGQRRIGKSSVLKQIPHKIALQEFSIVCFDFQEHRISSLGDILYGLTTEITEQLKPDLDIIPVFSKEKLNNSPDIFSDEFLPKIYQNLGKKNLLFLLDEFDVVSSDDNELKDRNGVFSYLHSLIKKHQNLFIIIVLGRFKDDLQNLVRLFKDAPSQEFNLLDENSARQLITKPAEGMLEYEKDAIKAIWELSSGHPYLIQIICFQLFNHLRLLDKSTANREDVEEIVIEVIESARGGLTCFSEGLSPSEKVVFSAVAEAQEIAINQKQSSPEDPFTRLKSYGVIKTEELTQAVKNLVKKGYLDDTGRRVKIELVRSWLLKVHPLKQEIFQLEEIKKEEINQILKKSKLLYVNGKIKEQIDYCEEILKINPNHFSTILILADSYLEIESFDKGLELYHRAYQIDSIRNKEGLLLAREAYGTYLIKQGQLIQARVQFEGVLEMDHDRESAKQNLLEINAELEKENAPQIENQETPQTENQQSSQIKVHNQLITWIRKPVISRKIALIIGIVGGGIGVLTYQFVTSCSNGQEKNNGICVSSETPLATSNPTITPTATPLIFSDDFLPPIYHKLGNKKLVLLLDEFDVVGGDNSIVNQGSSFFRYLQLLLKKEGKLFIIPVLGRIKDDLENLLDLFKDAPFQEVGLLNDLSARRLITKPAQGMLEYKEDAIKAILELSSGHPYFTQAICFNLFLQAKIAEKYQVTREDVNSFIDKTIESVQAGLAWFWDGLSIDEKVVFSAVAESQKIAIEQKQSFPEDPFTGLKNYGIIQTEDLIQATIQLVNKGYLDDTWRRVKIELVRLWLVQYHPLSREIFQLEEIKKEEINKEEINKVSEKAKQLYKQGNIKDEIYHYEKILTINPNHFSTIPILAESYLEVKNFDQALTLYTRAYQADPIRNKEGLLLARETYGKYLIKQGELIKAKVQYEGVLEIEPDRESAKYKLQEIEAEIYQKHRYGKAEIDKQHLETNSLSVSKTLIRQGVIWGTIATFFAIVGSSVSIRFYQSLTSCPQGQQKWNDKCVTTVTPLSTANNNIESNISRGDRTLFFTISDTYRDEGIEAFKEDNYSQAIKFFDQAVTANRNDPEVRIYYNNAIARQRGNLFTLAVVVPAENGRDRSQEILRGVAQSQEQFNANGGRDGRSLEIVIANDGDDPKQAQQIAQQLVNDKSVLGVIGHGSSTTTNAALNIYKQADIPIISPTSSANTLYRNNFFRTTSSDTAFGKKLAKYAIASGLNKVAIFYNSENSYSNSLREKFENNFKGQIISLIDLNKKTLNIEQELKDSASQQAQAVILLPNVEHVATALDIAKVNVDNKLGLKLLGGDTLYNQKTLEEGGNAVEGLVVAVPWFREAPQARDFSQGARELWGREVSWRTATSYDATQAFINSLSAQPSRETILQKLTQINLSAKLTSGNELKFQKGERQSEAILVKVKSGKFICLNKCSP